MDAKTINYIGRTERDKYATLYRDNYGDVDHQHRLKYQQQLGAFMQQRMKKTENALELGCGAGGAVEYLLKKGYDVIGADITLERIKNISSGRYTEAPLWKLPFSDNQFDFTYSADVLEHIPTELVDIAIKEICRVTRKHTIHIISIKPSPQGKRLHPTVMPIEWWEKLFMGHNTKNIKVYTTDCDKFFKIYRKIGSCASAEPEGEIVYVGKPLRAHAISDTSDFPLVVSFYTAGTYYIKEARGLIKTLKAFGIEYDIRGLKPSTSWRLNSNMKWAFILDRMREHSQRDIVWLDADSRLRQYPGKLKGIDCDLALHFIDWSKYPRTAGVPLSYPQAACGTFYIKNIPEMRYFMEGFIELRVKYPLEPDSALIKDYIDFGSDGVTIYNLPATYCQIFDTMSTAGKPVIEQMQASRRATSLLAGKHQQRKGTCMKENPSIDIAIPTLNRQAKCTVCVDSILAGNYLDVQVAILLSDQNELFRYAKQYQHDKRVWCEMTDYSKVSTCWNDFVAKSEADLLLFLCDDCELEPDSLVNAVKTLRRQFPDGDGIVGMNVTNYPPSWPEAITQYGFRLVGKKFHARFPEGQAYCPEYYRFYVDTEMGEHAKHVGKFCFCKEARMKHYHPDAPGGVMDDTHHKNRGEKQQWDNEIWKARQAAGYYWGRNFDMVGVR